MMYRNYKLTTYIHIPLAELSCSILTYDIMIMFLLIFFVSFENISIYRSEIHIYELKGQNDQLRGGYIHNSFPFDITLTIIKHFL